MPRSARPVFMRGLILVATMAHCLDLTPYEYFPGEPSLVNVGWLGADHAFPRGPVTCEFADELRRMVTLPVKLCRGAHVCEFCKPPQDILKLDENYYWVWALFRSGNGEVRVTNGAGLTFAAPVLILHYVAEHQYLPPKEFIEAVLFHREQRVKQESAKGWASKLEGLASMCRWIKPQD